jgi:signal transduction histidine kinase
MSDADLARAEDLLARRDELYALVFHDLRNPLNTISMSCALLADDVQPSGKETVARIRRAVDRMEKLLRDVSELTRYERGQVSLDRASLSAGDLAMHAFEPFMRRADERHLKLDTGAVDPALRVDVDRERFLQALSAMIDNAIRVSPEGAVVRLDVRAEDGDVEFAVKDTGPGLSAEEQATVFTRHLPVNKRRGQALALGLALASHIAQLHRGSVAVESEPGKGATFKLRVKRAA